MENVPQKRVRAIDAEAEEDETTERTTTRSVREFMMVVMFVSMVRRPVAMVIHVVVMIHCRRGSFVERRIISRRSEVVTRNHNFVLGVTKGISGRIWE